MTSQTNAEMGETKFYNTKEIKKPYTYTEMVKTSD
jgi:hypothetical protein